MPHPAIKKLSVSEVFDEDSGKPRADVVMKHFVSEGRLEEKAALLILTEVTALLRSEDTMIDVEAPVTGLASPAHFNPYLQGRGLRFICCSLGAIFVSFIGSKSFPVIGCWER